MSWFQKNALWVLAASTLLSRVPFRATLPYGLDSVQFILAVEEFDVRLHQPHPPGYFLFVMAGRALNWLVRDPNLSFVTLNILFSVATVWLCFFLGREVFDAESGLYSALLMATSPVFWFHGEVALSNMMDCMMVCLTALFCWRSLNGDKRSRYLSACALGLSGGVRQNSLVFLLPLWFMSVKDAGVRSVAKAVVLMSVSISLWYFPMALSSGGVDIYQTALRDHWINAGWHGIDPAWLLFNAISVTYFLLLGLGVGCVVLLLGLYSYFKRTRWMTNMDDLKVRFFFLWLAPPLAFFLIVYSHPMQTGHSLLYLPALFLLLPVAIRSLVEAGFRHSHPDPPPSKSRWTRAVTGGSVLLLASFNLTVFLFLRTAVSAKTIREYQAQVADLASTVRLRFKPFETVLLNYDFMKFGFRDFAFHLPEYSSYQPKLYQLEGGPLMFASKDRKTRLVKAIEIPSRVKYFVFCADPLIRNPGFLDQVEWNNLPDEQLIQAPSGLRLFVGDVSDLPSILPGIPLRFHESQ